MERDPPDKDPVQAGEWEVACLPDRASAEWAPAAARDVGKEEGWERVVDKVAVAECVAGRSREAERNTFSEGGWTMPGGDGTGPMGMGPMTGRAAGFCAGYGVPGYMNPVPTRWGGAWNAAPGYCGPAYHPHYGAVRGAYPWAYGAPRFGWGFGRGRGGWGRRNMFYATGLAGWQRAGFGWGRGRVRAPYGYAW